MKQYTVAILGATGAVGTQMLECLNEQEFPVGKLKLLASARSAGKTVEFRGEQVVIEEACPEAFEGCDIVLGAAGDDIAKELLPEAVKRGAVVVDNSHAFRMDPEVPLVVPEINADDIKWHHGLIANPNCATIIGLVPTWPLHQLAGVKRMIVSTYQAASGAGAPGMAELESAACRPGPWRGDSRAARVCRPAGEQPDSADRRRQGGGLYLRGDEAAKRGPQDHAPARAARELHLRARARAALALREHYA